MGVHALVNGRTRKRSAAGGWSEAEVCAEEVTAPRKPLRQHREATASGSADAKGYREAAAGREAFPSREGTRQHREAAAGREGTRQHREETPSREEAKMSMGSEQRASAWQLGGECIKERGAGGVQVLVGGLKIVSVPRVGNAAVLVCVGHHKADLVLGVGGEKPFY